MANVLVTGAAGFIGSHTVDQLLMAGHKVYGVDNLRTGRKSNVSRAIAAGLEFHQFDLLDSMRLNSLMSCSKIDAIIHLAALVSVTESIENPKLNYELNIEATYKVAEAARENGVRRLVFASSAAVYGDSGKEPLKEDSALRPISPYGSAKVASEFILKSYAMSYGITVRIQRYFNVYGLRQDATSPYSGVISIFADNFYQGRHAIIYGDGEQTRDFIHVSDVAAANLLAATKVGVKTGVANICTGDPTSLLNLLGTFSRFAKMTSSPVLAEARVGDIRHSVGCPDAATQEFGFVAKCSLEQGLGGLIENKMIQAQ